jgi:hypothetical protein
MTKIKEMNCATGEEIERDMTPEELEQLTIDQEEKEARTNEEIQRATDKAALLSQLGITAEQAKLLLS